jgi:hypothetical protein
MVAVVAALILVMAVTLILALITTSLVLVYVSIVCSVLAAALLIGSTVEKIKAYKQQG